MKKLYSLLAVMTLGVVITSCSKPCGNHTILYSVDQIQANPMRVVYKDLINTTNISGVYATVVDTVTMDSLFLQVTAPLTESAVSYGLPDMGMSLYANTCSDPEPYPNAPLKKLTITADKNIGNYTAGASLVGLFDIIVKERYSDNLLRMDVENFLNDAYYTESFKLVFKNGVVSTVPFNTVSFIVEYKKVDNSVIYTQTVPVTLWDGYSTI